ncbi:MAG: hypothetical protein LBC48_06110, partial [Dysgonamonadaceae bacterium]|nr:hypothetical protein [Dysgonamonadaceae bacterium]
MRILDGNNPKDLDIMVGKFKALVQEYESAADLFESVDNAMFEYIHMFVSGEICGGDCCSQTVCR